MPMQRLDDLFKAPTMTMSFLLPLFPHRVPNYSLTRIFRLSNSFSSAPAFRLGNKHLSMSRVKRQSRDARSEFRFLCHCLSASPRTEVFLFMGLLMKKFFSRDTGEATALSPLLLALLIRLQAAGFYPQHLANAFCSVFHPQGGSFPTGLGFVARVIGIWT